MTAEGAPVEDGGAVPVPRRLLPLRSMPRKVLFFGKNMSRTRCTGALVEALGEHGLDVRWINLATLRRWLGRQRALERARSVYRRYAPDLVFVFVRDLPRELLIEFGHDVPTVLWVEDALENLDLAHVHYMREGHLVCISNPDNYHALTQHGVDRLLFQMSGFSPTFHYPEPRRADARDVAFIGGPGKRGQRADFVHALNTRCHTEVFGVGWEEAQRRLPSLRVRGSVGPRGYRRICASSRIVLGLNEVNGAAYYFSNRTWLSLGCGAFHLTHYVPGLEEVFHNHHHLVWYNDLGECQELVEHYLPRAAERGRIARTGHALAVEQHRYTHRVARILEQLREPRGVAPPARVVAAAPLVAARSLPSRAE